ncbi:hypothetical protein ACEPAF_230 [Sanghuangporus sanghuang]
MPMLGVETVHATLSVAKEVTETVQSFFDARSSADRHASVCDLERTSVRFLEYLAEQHSRAANGDDRVASALADTFADTQVSFLKYESQVKKWCRLVGSDFAGDKDYLSLPKHIANQISTSKDMPTAQGKSSRRRRLAPLSRAKYILFGNRRIIRHEERYKRSRDTFCNLIMAWSTIVDRMDVAKSPPAAGGVPALVRFVALAKERCQTDASIFMVEGVNLSKYETSPVVIDPNMVFTSLPALAIKTGDLLLKHKEENIQGLRSYENCVIVKRSGGDFEESLSLARLFAEDPSDKFSRGFFTDPPDGAMLRCCAVVRKNSEFDLYFRIPEGCSIQTLRQILPTSSSSRPIVPNVDRIKFSIRLATAVLVIHSLGLVHKLIHPETILVAQKELYFRENHSRLGFPYLAAFQSARPDTGITLKKADVEAYRMRGIYFHPRDQRESEHRAERYSMEDDIYSLGVCLFEVGLWRSLLVWDESINENEYVYDDSFVALSDRNTWPGFTMKERARAKLDLLVREARRLLPKALGSEYTDVVVSCLTVGYDENPFKEEYEACRDESSDDPVAAKYLESVLSKLRRIHQSYKT